MLYGAVKESTQTKSVWNVVWVNESVCR